MAKATLDELINKLDFNSELADFTVEELLKELQMRCSKRNMQVSAAAGKLYEEFPNEYNAYLNWLSYVERVIRQGSSPEFLNYKTGVDRGGN